MGEMTEVVWSGIEWPSLERCRVDEGAGGVRVTSTIENEDGTCTYDLRADADWQFESLVISSASGTLTIERRTGTWTVNGAPRPDLDDAGLVVDYPGLFERRVAGS